MSCSRSDWTSTVLGVNCDSGATNETVAGKTYSGAASTTTRASSPILSRPACGPGRIYGRVDVREIDHRRDLAAGRKHRPRLDEAILHPAADRRLDRRVVDHRLQLFDLGVGGLDGRLGFVDLRLGRLEGRIRAIQLLCALVVLFVGGPTFCDQRRRAPHLLVRELQLGLVAGDFRETGCDRLAGERRRGLRLGAAAPWSRTCR